MNRLALWLLPKRTLTAAAAAFARHSVSRLLIPWYVRHYHIDVQDAELDIKDYRSLLSFFSRTLKSGSRPLATSWAVSPVDGTVSELGPICKGTLLQAKGCDYSVEALLGDSELAPVFQDGTYITLYLSPRDYHRIHMPVDGTITNWRYIPGNLFPVNQHGVQLIPGLYTKNERLVTLVKTESGLAALIKVGATVVGSVRTVYGPMFPHAFSRERRTVLHAPAHRLSRKGEEIGRFEFGSTVILLFQKGMAESFCVKKGDFIRMGQALVVPGDLA